MELRFRNLKCLFFFLNRTVTAALPVPLPQVIVQYNE